MGEDVRYVVCDAGGVGRPDLATVDAVARLRLLAGRRGHRLRLVGAGSALRELLVLAGLDESLAPEDRPGEGSASGVGRQAEEREQAGVEEHDQAGDAPPRHLDDVQ